jgi:light-regulated signal transduction histidine kinase (bacteriophytochrome)
MVPDSAAMKDVALRIAAVASGQAVEPIALLPEHDDGLAAVIEAVNLLIANFKVLREFSIALADGRVDFEVPPRMHLLDPLKSLQASLKHLTWQTQEVAAGDYDQRVDFLGEFSVAFNRMASALREKEQAERQAMELLQQRSAALEQANQELESFSYSVSHDLRAPLRAIDGFSRILMEECDSQLGEDGRRYTATISQNAARMGQLISDILDFSRMSRREIAMTPVNMTELAREVYEEVRGAAPAERNIVFRMGDLPPASGDRAMLRQVWVNLLSNAVKYTGQRSEAAVEAGSSAANGENTYWVKDNGAGFDMRCADKLFGVFQRLHSDSEFEGTGIGLAIVKRIVTRHGGRVWAESTPGEGATFYFALPAKKSGGDLA